jgi:large subunit ribosomal protein L17
MPAPKKGPRFGRSAGHQKLMMANMAASLFEAGAITTTLTRAKALRPYAEKLITKAKQGGVHRQRLVVGRIHDKSAAAMLFALELEALKLADSMPKKSVKPPASA